MHEFQNQNVEDKAFLKRYGGNEGSHNSSEPRNSAVGRHSIATGSPVDISKISPLRFSMRLGEARPSAIPASSRPLGSAIFDDRRQASTIALAESMNNQNNYQSGYGVSNQRFSISRPEQQQVGPAYQEVPLDAGGQNTSGSNQLVPLMNRQNNQQRHITMGYQGV